MRHGPAGARCAQNTDHTARGIEVGEVATMSGGADPFTQDATGQVEQNLAFVFRILEHIMSQSTRK